MENATPEQLLGMLEELQRNGHNIDEISPDLSVGIIFVPCEMIESVKQSALTAGSHAKCEQGEEGTCSK